MHGLYPLGVINLFTTSPLLNFSFNFSLLSHISPILVNPSLSHSAFDTILTWSSLAVQAGTQSLQMVFTKHSPSPVLPLSRILPKPNSCLQNSVAVCFNNRGSSNRASARYRSGSLAKPRRDVIHSRDLVDMSVGTEAELA